MRLGECAKKKLRRKFVISHLESNKLFNVWRNSTGHKPDLWTRRVATCKPGKPGLASFFETLALFFIQSLSFRKMKVQDKQNGPSGLPEKTGWLRACMDRCMIFEQQLVLIAERSVR